MSGYLDFTRKVYKDRASQIVMQAGEGYEAYGPPKEPLFYPQDLFSPDSAPFVLFFAVHPTKTDLILDKIALYMPRDIQVNYGLNFAEATNYLNYANSQVFGDIKDYISGVVGNTGASSLLAAATAYSAIRGLRGGGAIGAMTGATRAAVDLVSQSNSIGQTLSINTKKTLNPHLAATFQGVSFRRHPFTFDLVARNEEESDVINKIIYTFKYHAHPEAGNPDSQSTFWEWPSAWHIGLFSPARKYLYNISTCHINNIAVNYTSGGTRAFFSNTGAPVAVKLYVEFVETELMTRGRIRQGY